MEFHSYVYVFAFLPVAVLVYHVSSSRILGAMVLIAASAVFYGWQTYWYFFPMAFSAILDYKIGQKLYKTRDNRLRRFYLLASIILNLSLLSFFKYTTWLTTAAATHLNGAFGLNLTPVGVPLPPGISFYTFQTMSYTIDIYRNQFRPTGSFLHYVSYVTFFPQLVAGPIERAKDLLPQLSKRPQLPSADAFSAGILLILWGLTVKLLFADNFGSIVELIQLRYLNPERMYDGLGLVYAYGFTLQIYADFLAYTTIAIGTAKLFDINLSHNFKTPYFSQSPSEFWGRWHITLSTWFRDYVYIPLGGNRISRSVTFRNLCVTMFLAGLWHGAGLNFIVWGLVHGFLLVVYHVLPLDRLLPRWFGRAGRGLSILVFFHILVLTWIPFRAEFSEFGAIFSSLFGVFTGGDYGPSWTIFTWLAIYAVPFILLDMITWWQKEDNHAELIHKLPWPVKTVFAVVCVYGLIWFGARQENEFIYFQF